MLVEVVALCGGIVFLLIAIAGGGFTARVMAIPGMPNWARVISGTFGLLLLLSFMLTVLRGEVTEDKAPLSNGGLERQPAERVRSGIEVDAEPETTGDQIRLTGLMASVRNDPPRKGDTITVKYSLTNVGEKPIQMEYTFVGARNPADDNKDAEDGNEGRVLAPGETIDAERRVFLDSPGTWTLWPCYALPDGRFCPDEWKAFSVIVE